MRRVIRPLIGACLALAACGGGDARSTPQSGTPQPAPEARAAEPATPPFAATPPEPAEVPLVRARRELMSTIYEISVVTGQASRAREVMERALDEIARLEQVLSEWLPESDVSHVNAAAGQHPVKVGPDTLANVRASLDAARATGGAFDITWASLRSFYLFQPGERRAPDLEAVQARRKLVNYREIDLDEAASTVFLRRAGMAIGLGGIAKGWAADRASAILREAGFTDHMVFAGGQVLVSGLKAGRKWRIGIQHPRREGYVGFVEATDASIGTAGDYEHAFIAEDGTRWHHIIDPDTGLPATRSSSVTIVAPNGLLADALDTGCFVMGPERCIKMLAEQFPSVEAVIFDRDLKLYTTPGMRERLVLRTELDAAGRLAN